MSEGPREIAPLTRPPDACVVVPGSKSISNRALLVAALAEGRSCLEGALFSDDTRYMADGLRRLGVAVTEDEAASRFEVEGTAAPWPATAADIYVGNAGTAMRFLAAAVCLGTGRYRLDGTARMRERPIGDLVEGLRALGARVRCEGSSDCPPVVVEAAGLSGGKAKIAGNRSSQFLSALLMVAPFARRDVEIVVPGGVIAQPYVDMTIRVMEQWGVGVERDAYRRFSVRCGQRYRARTYAIEPDASGAHYFLAAAALTGGCVRVPGLGRNSLQGDVRFAELLERMGAEVHWLPDAIEVRGRNELHGVEADMNEISDTFPTLAVLGAFAASPVVIRNVEHARWQESDRLAAVAAELARLGVRVEERSDGLTVWPSAVRGGEVKTYDDHRIAMAFALAGLRVPGIRILDPGCVSKTFPDYFERLERLRGGEGSA